MEKVFRLITIILLILLIVVANASRGDGAMVGFVALLILSPMFLVSVGIWIYAVYRDTARDKQLNKKIIVTLTDQDNQS